MGRAGVRLAGAEVLANETVRPTYTGFWWYPYLILHDEKAQRKGPAGGSACMEGRDTTHKQNATYDRQLLAVACFLTWVFLPGHTGLERRLLSLL